MLIDFAGLVLLRRTQPTDINATEKIVQASSALCGQPAYRRSTSDLIFQFAVNTTHPAAPSGTGNWYATFDSRHCLLSGKIDDLIAPNAETFLRGLPNKAPESYLASLSGQYCAVIFDEKSGACIAARDHIGHEPLYYVLTDLFFAFSTSFKALRRLLAGAETPDELGIADYLALTHRDSERTLLAEIRRLPPAHWLTVDASGTLHTRRYWSLRSYKGPQFSNAADCYRQFRDLVIDTVSGQVDTADRAGLMLSGGLDSSSLGAAYFRTDSGKLRPLLAIGSTCSNVVGDTRLDDETAFMRSFVSLYPQTDLEIQRNVIASPLDTAQTITDIGFPHRDLYFYELREMSARMKERGADLIISGLGGDFYASSKVNYFYSYMFWRGHIRTGLRQAEIEEATSGAISAALLLARQVARPLVKPLISLACRNLKFHNDDWASPATLCLRDGFARKTCFYRRALKSGFVADPRIFDSAQESDARLLECGAIAHILEYTAALSRAIGVRISSPLLDQKIIQFAASAPVQYRRHGHGGRSLLRNAFAELLPELIARRTTKGNFMEAAIQAAEKSLADEMTQISGNQVLSRYIDVGRFTLEMSAFPTAHQTPESQIDKLLRIFVVSSLGHFLCDE